MGLTSSSSRRSLSPQISTTSKVSCRMVASPGGFAFTFFRKQGTMVSFLKAGLILLVLMNYKRFVRLIRNTNPNQAFVNQGESTDVEQTRECLNTLAPAPDPGDSLP
jgi:hypothetical protein